MNLRKEIEKLIYWYVPAYIFTVTIGITLASYAKNIEDPTLLVSYVVIPLGMLAKSIDNFVIAFWIYQIAKQDNQKYILWSLFGLVAHIFAAIIFIALNVLEDKFDISKEKSKEELVEPDL